MTDGYLRQEGTAAGHTGHPAVDHNLPLVRSLAVGHSPAVVVLRRSLAVRVPETLLKRKWISMHISKLARRSKDYKYIELFDKDPTLCDEGIG